MGLIGDARGAVSYRIVIFLIALLVAALVYSVLGDAVAIIEPEIIPTLDTAESTQMYDWLVLIWGLAPVMIVIATGAWLLKQGVIVQQ